MPIKNRDTFSKAAWDWTFVKGMGHSDRIYVGDIDGVLEHCGKLLILEGRSMSRAPKIGQLFQSPKDNNNGQVRTWRTMAAHGITIVLFWGEAPDPKKPNCKIPQRMQIWQRFKTNPDFVISADAESAKDFVHNWWEWTEIDNMYATKSRNEYRAITGK